uniref:SH3 domain-containing protein n=1 Tax=Anopheles melas TaxID=34690 RepID=A0A182U5G3_9DIPT
MARFKVALRSSTTFSGALPTNKRSGKVFVVTGFRGLASKRGTHNRVLRTVANLSELKLLAKATFDNIAESTDELAFRKGEILTVIETDTNGLKGWWLCQLRGRQH